MKNHLKLTHFVIVTYNGERFIEACIKAIQNESPNSPIHIVDNGSNDRTLDILSTLGIDVLQTGENLGFGRANNIGISNALQRGAEHVFLVNQDAYLETGSLTKFYSKQEIHTPALHAFVQLNGEGSRLDEKFRSHYMSHSYCPNLLDDLFFNRTKSSYETRFANAAAWVIPKDILLAIGGFNPSFFHYGEDDNYINRLHFHGYKLLLHPDCIVYHDREDRPKSQYFTDSSAKKRLFLQRISHPSNNQSRRKIQSSLTLTYLKKRLRGQSKANCIEHLQLEFLKETSLSRIIQNRDKSSKPGPSFLSIN